LSAMRKKLVANGTNWSSSGQDLRWNY